MATLALCGVGVPQAGGGARVPATFSEFMSIPAFRGLLDMLATMTVADLWPTGEELLSHRTGDEPLSSDVGWQTLRALHAHSWNQGPYFKQLLCDGLTGNVIEEVVRAVVPLLLHDGHFTSALLHRAAGVDSCLADM